METGYIHRMRLPREVLVGQGVLGQTSSICKRLGFKSSVTILASSRILDTMAEDVVGSLERDGFRVMLDVVKGSNISNVEEAENDIVRFKPSVVLGIGGGKVIDVAKLAASQKNVPFISIPTALSHDGISSSRASIKALTGLTSIEAQAPIAIIGDLQIISKSPYRLTASGCGDIVAKQTAVSDWKLAHRAKGEYYGEYAANLALMSAKLIMRHANIIRGEKEEGLRIVLEALISCGVAISIAGSSRPCSGSEHLFSHALDIVAPRPALHGEQCGVGSIMMAFLWKADWRCLKKKLEIIGVPTTAEGLGIEAEYIIEALTLAHKIRSDRYTILDVKNLDRKAAEELALAAGVI
jgi:glycerol-1-phosphate dehydrogenase [NAD(P)+]